MEQKSGGVLGLLSEGGHFVCPGCEGVGEGGKDHRRAMCASERGLLSGSKRAKRIAGVRWRAVCVSR